MLKPLAPCLCLAYRRCFVVIVRPKYLTFEFYCHGCLECICPVDWGYGCYESHQANVQKLCWLNGLTCQRKLPITWMRIVFSVWFKTSLISHSLIMWAGEIHCMCFRSCLIHIWSLHEDAPLKTQQDVHKLWRSMSLHFSSDQVPFITLEQNREDLTS